MYKRQLLAEAEEAASQVTEHGVLLVILAVALGVAVVYQMCIRDRHFLLAGVHRAVGVDDGAQPIASPAHALEFGHHPALLLSLIHI